MKITFGFGLDGAAWTPSSSLGELTVGPAGLSRVLATRLGVTIPVLDKPERIVAYRERLSGIVAHNQEWLRDSFEVDAWAVASQLLDWRDELVAAGVDPRNVPDGVSQRVDAIKAAERPSPITGPADLIIAVADALKDYPGLDLGLKTVILRDPYEDLPPVWKSIVDALGDVVVEESTGAPALKDKLFVTAQHDFEAADVIIAELRKAAKAGIVPQLLATTETAVLDAELLRAGFAPVGKTTNVGGAQALTAFVTAATTAGAVPEIVDLLLMQIEGDTLFNYEASGKLLYALGREYGFGGKWAQAIERLTGDAKLVAKGIDKHLAHTELDDEISVSRLQDALEWFATTARGDSLREAARQLSTLLAHYSVISRRELDHLLTTVSQRVAAWSIRPAATNDYEVITDPAHVRPGATVLWWGALADGVSGMDTWSAAEHAGFNHAVLPAKKLTALRSAAQLRALRSAERVIAVVQKQIVGEKGTRPHQVLAQLVAEDVAAGAHFEDFFVTASSLLKSELTQQTQKSWPTRPELTKETFTPGTQLLPDYMSYSQLEKLLARPLEWVLEKPLEISLGSRRRPSTGNAMVGSMFHKALEHIHEAKLDEWDEDSITAAIEQAIGEVGVELNAPGQLARRQSLVVLGVRSLLTLQRELRNHSWKLVDTEAQFDKPLDVTVQGAPNNTWVIEKFEGFRDLDIQTSGGRPGVIDAKYTTSRNKYQDVVRNNEALQLAVYACGVGFEKAAPTAYWEFRRAKLIKGNGSTMDQELFERAKTLLSKRLTDIAAGLVVDEAHEKLRDPDTKAEKLAKQIRGDLGDDFFFPDTVKYRDYDVLTGVKGNY